MRRFLCNCIPIRTFGVLHSLTCLLLTWDFSISERLIVFSHTLQNAACINGILPASPWLHYETPNVGIWQDSYVNFQRLFKAFFNIQGFLKTFFNIQGFLKGQIYFQGFFKKKSQIQEFELCEPCMSLSMRENVRRRLNAWDSRRMRESWQVWMVQQ